MAQMYPPVISDDAAPGERALFAALAGAPGSEDWIVLHSLRLAVHPRQHQGEIDFVVIVPDCGVAVIEVKSHLSVARDSQGRWLLGRAQPSQRSPLTQADDAKFAIVEFLRPSLGLTNVHFESCVWFTHAPARRDLQPSIEWGSWQVLDRADLDGDIADRITSVITTGRSERAADRVKPEVRLGPDKTTAMAMLRRLRPALHSELQPADIRRLRSEELARLLDEQLELLNALADNERVLVVGPAGCGKTFMALEAARREVALGRRGLLLCFNRAIAEHLRAEAGDIPGLTVSTLHDVMLDAAGIPAGDHNDREFWEQQLPQAAADELIDQDQSQLVDYLILDEAQDICRPQFLDVLDVLNKGGLRAGRWMFFGDFDSQILYATSPREVMADVAGDFATFGLRVNCRNQPGIGRAAEQWGRSEQSYARYRRGSDGSDPTLHIYTNEEEQQRLLVTSVRELVDEGFGLNEIVVLSRYRESAAARCHDTWLAPLLDDYRRGGAVPRGRLRYSTIHSFKGLEAPAVVLTDVNESTRGPYFDLLNVGITRARDRLVVLATGAGLDQHGIDRHTVQH